MGIDKFGRSGERIRRGPRGPPGEGFIKLENGDYSLNMKRLQNAGEPKEKDDVATKKYVDDSISTSIKECENLINKMKDDGNTTVTKSLKAYDDTISKILKEFAEIIERITRMENHFYTHVLNKTTVKVNDEVGIGEVAKA